MKENTMERNGKKIFYRLWDEAAQPKGIIQVAHGMVEHTLRYNEFAGYCNRAGYIVIADEHRGHGNTDPDTLGYCDGEMFFDTMEDMYELMHIAKQAYPDLPYILFGFSYGSFLTQYFIGKYMDELDGVILGGSNKNPAVAVWAGRFVSGMGAAFKGKASPARLVKKLTFGAYDSHFADKCFLSVNKESNAKYFADPFCSYTCSNHFYRCFFDGLATLYSKKYAEGIVKSKPILIVSGQDDPVGDMGKGTTALYRYYQKIGCTDVTLKLYPSARHEFLNEEPDRANDLIAFCDRVIQQ